MAKLSAYGRTQISAFEIARIGSNGSYVVKYRLMSDGTVLGNMGYGWTVYRKNATLLWFRAFERAVFNPTIPQVPVTA